MVMYDVLSNFNKTRIDVIVTVEIAMVEAIDRFKRDPLGTRSRIATIPLHLCQGLETMKATLNRDSTVQVQVELPDSVNNAHHPHQRPQGTISALVMIFNSLRLGLVPQGEV